MIKLRSYWINHFNRYDWHVNIIPVINFGNQAYGKGFVINIGWIVWFWNINVQWKPKKKVK